MFRVFSQDKERLVYTKVLEIRKGPITTIVDDRGCILAKYKSYDKALNALLKVKKATLHNEKCYIEFPEEED